MAFASLFNDPFGMIVGIVLVSVGVPVLGGYWYKATVRKSDNRLKQSLVDRGMSVEEIERVLKAGPREKDDDEA